LTIPFVGGAFAFRNLPNFRERQTPILKQASSETIFFSRKQADKKHNIIKHWNGEKIGVFGATAMTHVWTQKYQI